LNRKSPNINDTADQRRFRNAWKAGVGIFVAGVLLAVFFSSIDLPLGTSEQRATQAGGGLRKNVWYGPRRSVAVLAFEDMSPGRDQAWLAEGVARVLIERLEHQQRIQVAARTSSFFFKGRPDSVQAVAQRLTVTHVLRGGIAETALGYEVSAQLMHAPSEKELWSGQWEVEPVGIFPVLDEILAQAQAAIVSSASDQAPARKAIDPEAWSQYLRGQYYADRLGRRNPEAAEAAYREALDIEPEFARAWLGLANVYLDRAGSSAGDALDTARQLVGAALELAPALAEAYAVTSYIQRTYDWDFDTAADSAARALELNPGSSGFMSLVSMNEFTLGRFAQATEALEQAIRRDPLQLRYRLRLGLLQEFAGKHGDALSTYSQLLSLSPGYPAAHAYRGRAKIARGDSAGALAEAEKETDAFWQAYMRIIALSGLDRGDEADVLLRELEENRGHDAAFQIAEIRAYRGEEDQAFQWLRRAMQQRDGGMTEVLGNPMFTSLWPDTRWPSLMLELGLPASPQSGDK
jgi:TolB-like protein/cytochrome c-type biogenesis protein CcmH/NrfG